MKKILSAVLVVIVVLLGYFVIIYLNRYSFEKGDISSVQIIPIESENYSNNEINNAIDVILQYFEENFSGCLLLEIGYIGDEKNNDYINWAIRNSKTDVIVLISKFKVDSHGGDGSLNPNSEYDDWKWILVRNKDEEWKHVDHGYT